MQFKRFHLFCSYKLKRILIAKYLQGRTFWNLFLDLLSGSLPSVFASTASSGSFYKYKNLYCIPIACVQYDSLKVLKTFLTFK